jgi:2-dehydropantoate 2-reductase
MLLDHLAQRRCEVDVINGAVVAAAASVGLMAPVNETVTALILAREAQFAANA